MPIFALLVEFQGGPPSDDLLDAHRTWLYDKFDQGRFILSGGMEAVPGRPPSALALFEEEDQAAAEALVDDEPMLLAGALVHQVVPFIPRVRAADMNLFFGVDTKAIARTG
jgi:uncharacterized protein YciI